MKAAAPRQKGFSLLELLVAFSIMAMSLGILYRATGSSARNVGDAEQYQHAVILAESLMMSRESLPASGWNESGQAGSFAWDARTAPFGTDLSRTRPDAVKLHQLSVTVSWGAGEGRRQMELVTLIPEGLPRPLGSIGR